MALKIYHLLHVCYERILEQSQVFYSHCCLQNPPDKKECIRLSHHCRIVQRKLCIRTTYFYLRYVDTLLHDRLNILIFVTTDLWSNTHFVFSYCINYWNVFFRWIIYRGTLMLTVSNMSWTWFTTAWIILVSE